MATEFTLDEWSKDGHMLIEQFRTATVEMTERRGKDHNRTLTEMRWVREFYLYHLTLAAEEDVYEARLIDPAMTLISYLAAASNDGDSVAMAEIIHAIVQFVNTNIAMGLADMVKDKRWREGQE